MNRSAKKSNSRGQPTQRSQNWRRSRGQPAKGGQRRQNNVVTQHELHGGRIFVPSNPPDLTYQPWVHVTLAHAFTTEFSPKANDILGLLRTQLDPTHRGFNQIKTGDGRFVVQMKIFDIRAWNLTGKTIALSVDDFIDTRSASGGRDQLCGLVDTGSQVHTPAVGYLLPVTHRQHVLRTDDVEGSIYLFTVQANTSDQCFCYIKIAYRFDGPVVPPKLFLPMTLALNQLESNNANQLDSNEILKGIDISSVDIANIADHIKNNTPSLLRKTIDGIEYAAMAISALPAMDETDSILSKFEDLTSCLKDLETKGEEGLPSCEATSSH